jgi:hypothetical protein
MANWDISVLHQILNKSVRETFQLRSVQILHEELEADLTEIAHEEARQSVNKTKRR